MHIRNEIYFEVKNMVWNDISKEVISNVDLISKRLIFKEIRNPVQREIENNVLFLIGQRLEERFNK